MSDSYLKIAEYYNKVFNKYGDTPEGLAWDNQVNLDKRYEVMYDLIKHPIPRVPKVTLLDFGCGYGGFYKWIIEHEKNIQYTGIDINENLIKKAKELYPLCDFFKKDILNVKDFDFLQTFDYIICNGTFTVKDTLTQEKMTEFMHSVLKKLWNKTNKGIAFNVMSKHVDWERDDLFHVSIDELGWFLKNHLSRNFIIKNDYGLYEYTVYVYK
jgi:SAM-dependent methyltransferase